MPVTRALLDEFHRALAPMLFELLHRRPALRAGPSYWSISPIGRKGGRTAGGIPVGSVEDTAYFPRVLQPLLARVFAVPGEVARLPDVESCRYVTLWFLVAREDLALISVWNPSFLTLLMDALELHGERLAEDLERGTCRPPDRELGRRSVRAGPRRRMRFTPGPTGPEAPAPLALQEGLAGSALWPRTRPAQHVDGCAGRACRDRRAAASRASRSRARDCWPPKESSPCRCSMRRPPCSPCAATSTSSWIPSTRDARPRLAHELERAAVRRAPVHLGRAAALPAGRSRARGGLRRSHAVPALHGPSRRRERSRRREARRHPRHRRAGRRAPVLFGGTRPRFAMLAPEWEAPPAYRLFVETDARTSASPTPPRPSSARCARASTTAMRGSWDSWAR